VSEAARARREWGLAVALAALFAFTGIANHALQNPDEPRVAGIAWEMQHTGQWVPHLSGTPFLEHPPLYYAVLGAFIRAFGATDGVARLPSAIACVLTALLVFSLARHTADRSAGIPALLALVGIGGFARHSHRVLVDTLLTLFVMSGYYAYARAVLCRSRAERASPGWLWAMYGSAALAFWSKGPIGVIAIAGPVAVDAVYAGHWRALRSSMHWVAVPLLLAACAAWPIALYLAGGEQTASTFLLHNVWYRIDPASSGGLYHGGHERPFWYYGTRMFGQLGWIIVLLPAVAAWLWRGASPPGWRMPALRFLAWVFPIGLLLLSVPGTKRAIYLLPFEPPLAVAIGAWIVAAGRADAGRKRVEALVNALCARIARVDLAAAARGACRAPYRVAVLSFAIAIAWNAIGLRFVERDRELAPMARAIGARVGAEQLLVLRPSECLLGALPFYTGRIPLHSGKLEQVRKQLAQGDARFLLAPMDLRDRIASELADEAALAQTWTADDDDYVLFAITPAVALTHQRSPGLMPD
jgi:4-amino-4-deoxy-L-arabinose transferase-like glycosyltransferase